MTDSDTDTDKAPEDRAPEDKAPEPPELAEPPAAPPAPPPNWVSSGATDLGAVRKLNEDAFLDRGDVGLWAVADGMGGHSAGDYASSLIIERLQEIVPPENPGDFADTIEGTLLTIHDELTVEARRRGPKTVIGSTVVAVFLAGNTATMLWAGDSRLYRLRGSSLTQLTRDHSLVQDLVEAGELTQEQAEHHPQSNIITRAVGAGDELEVERRTDRVAPGDILLLCSDGLGRVVPQEDIVATLLETGIEDAAQGLIDKALAFRTNDNVTAVVIRVDRTAAADHAAGDAAGITRGGAPDEAGRPADEDEESTLPSRRRPMLPGAAEGQATPDFGDAAADAKPAPEFDPVSEPWTPPRDLMPEEAGKSAEADADADTADDWDRQDNRHHGAGQAGELAMIGVPPPPRQPGDTLARRDAKAGTRAVRGWPAVVLVAAGFAAILAALYLF